MKVNSAQLIISAVEETQYPPDGLPEFALLGRSNVGKSSFINAMINRKALARTSSQPGKTQTMNFYLINNDFHFVDLPGYGYAKVSQSQRQKWGKMIEYYLTNRPNLFCVFQLIDFRHPPTNDDIIMYNWLQHYNLNRAVIATKADKVKPSQRDKKIKVIRESLNFTQEDTLFIFSAQNKSGKEKVWEFIKEILV